MPTLWTVTTSINDGEYEGWLEIEAESVRMGDDGRTVIADNVRIVTSDPIVSIAPGGA